MTDQNTEAQKRAARQQAQDAHPDEYARALRLDMLVDTNQHIAAFYETWAKVAE